MPLFFSSDKIRKELIDKPTYRWQERRLVYDVLSLLARYLHNAGINCILDATFNTENSRKELKQKLDSAIRTILYNRMRMSRRRCDFTNKK